ncbi:VOC family protein [Hyphomonas sp.]|uniref:VOC family protein n=1 Tax=Hyphomonas sp. TaxID=87 RepID=UPI0025B8D902|nr:VOC family protein [Hyphomonas sp.]
MIRILLAMIALFAVAGCASADVSAGSGVDADHSDVAGLTGWNEIVITTRNVSDWHAFLTEDAGWELRARQPVGAGLKVLWNLPSTATGEEYVFANIGAQRGFIRLVQLEGVEQEMIRVDDRPWDTGGYFDFNVRVAGLWALREKMIARGWQGDSAPIQYTFGPFEVIEWIARGHDGVRVAFIERLNPELEGWPDLKIMSRTFNATQTVRDMDTARAFFQGVLGMQTYLEHVGASEVPGPNVLGLPHEAAAEIDRIVYILHPQGVNEGSVELLAFDGASGRDLSGHAKPANIGLSVLRYPVADLEATMRAISERGGKFEADPVTLDMAPYGRVRSVAMVAPDGGRLEIYQVLN